MTNKTANRIGTGFLLAIFFAITVAIFANTENHTPIMARQTVPQGNPLDAPRAVVSYGCGACHTIPGIAGAHGMVGPDLKDIATRSLLAGRVPNTPDNLIMWIQHPQMVKPGTDMPEMGVTDVDARNIAAYLYSLPDRKLDIIP